MRLKILLFFLFFTFGPGTAEARSTKKPGKGPNYEDTILHQTIRAAGAASSLAFSRGRFHQTIHAAGADIENPQTFQRKKSVEDAYANAKADPHLRKIVHALLEKQDPEIVNSINNEGETPLFLARPYPLTTKLLLQWGADPNLVVNEFGEFSVFQQILTTVSDPALLKIYFQWSQNPPDVNTGNDHFLSTLQEIWNEMWNRHELRDKEAKDLPLTENLWGYPNANVVDEDLSPLQYLLYDIFLFTEFIEAKHTKNLNAGRSSIGGAIVSVIMAHKERDHLLSVRYNREEQALLLINKGADLTYRDPFGKLPLHQAVRLGRSEIAERIIKTGGTQYLTSADRQDLIRLSIEGNHNKVVDLLKKKPFPGKPHLAQQIFNFCWKLFQ